MSNIDDDCLLMIFDIITRPMPHPQGIYRRGIDEDRERPLNTIRTASQVCRRWRGSLIDSPWIWGRLIDLDIVCLGGKRFDWLAEVLRRAGSEALLWITGRIFNTSTQPSRTAKGSRLWSTEKAFIYLLNSWERIEKLDVDIQVIGNTVTIPEEIQNRFISPAPNLKMFSVGVVSVHNPAGHNIVSQPEPSQSLFANYAPLLRTTRIRTDLISFKLDASWLSSITQTVPIPRRFNLNEVFVLLHKAPMLENIELVDPVVPPSDYLTLPIHLPNLTSIDLIANLEGCARFLDLLRPGRLSFCSINIPNAAAHSGDILPTTVIPAFKKSVPKLISNYFTANAHASTSVEITVHHSCFAFSTTQPHRNGYPQFLFRLYHEPQLNSVHEEVKSCLIEALAIAPSIEGGEQVELFGWVNELTLTLSESSLISNMYSMLTVFHRIQHLTIHEYGDQTLCTISRLDQTGNILFPELHTLHLILGGLHWTLPNYDQIAFMAISGSTEFFVERKRQGFPVRCLDLTAKGQYNCTLDLRELEQVDGLEVVWREKDNVQGLRVGLAGHPEARQGFSNGNEEGSSDPRQRCTYICGSGDPEQLKDIPVMYTTGDIDFERDFGAWFNSPEDWF